MISVGKCHSQHSSFVIRDNVYGVGVAGPIVRDGHKQSKCAYDSDCE